MHISIFIKRSSTYLTLYLVLKHDTSLHNKCQSKEEIADHDMAKKNLILTKDEWDKSCILFKREVKWTKHFYLQAMFPNCG